MNDETVKARTFDEFVGQEQLKRRLYIHMKACLVEQRPLEHVLLSGPLGSGKSTLAEIIHSELDDPITVLTMPMESKSLGHAITSFQGGILFLDEIHALPRKVQETLLPVLGRGVYVNSTGNEYPCGWITVIAATTERDKVIGTLQSRFPIRPEFEPYTDEELGLIISGMAVKANVEMDEQTAIVLGRACGGIPRNGEQFVFSARALASTLGRPATSAEVLDLCSTDPDGLTELHRRYLTLLTDQGGKAGQKTIEGLLRVPGEYCRELERLLVDKKLINYTPSGRILTSLGESRASGRLVEKRYSRDDNRRG